MRAYTIVKRFYTLLFCAGICYLVLFIFSPPAITDVFAWKAGVSSEIITPEEPIWMGGYGSRKEPFQGKINDLFVKALALEGPEGKRVVIIAINLCFNRT